MPNKSTRKRQGMKIKQAYVTVYDAQLGWSGPRGGRTVSVIFRDGQGRKVGKLEISAARVRWWPRADQKPYIARSTELDEVFRTWWERKR